MTSTLPLYILVVNDGAKEAIICRRVDPGGSGPATPEGTYTPYATGARPEMKQLYKDLTQN